MKTTALPVLACLCGLSSLQAQQQNLIGNPGFERSIRSFSPWGGVSTSGFLESPTNEADILTQAGGVIPSKMPVSISAGDLNGDGLPDIAAMDGLGYLKIYFNTGTKTEPKFATPEYASLFLNPLPLMRPVNLQAVNLHRSQGTQRIHLADVMKTGKLDLFIGTYGGTLHFISNSGGPARPDFRNPSRPEQALVKTGSRIWANILAPHAVDWNKDGRLDLLVGERSGRIAPTSTPALSGNPSPNCAPPSSSPPAPARSPSTTSNSSKKNKSQMKLPTLLLIASLAIGATNLRAQEILAEDYGSDPAYGGGWNSGTQGGRGFGPWTHRSAGNLHEYSHSGFGTRDGHPTLGDKVFTMWANGEYYETAVAFRAFDKPLETGGTFSLVMENGPFERRFDNDGFLKVRKGKGRSERLGKGFVAEIPVDQARESFPDFTPSMMELWQPSFGRWRTGFFIPRDQFPKPRNPFFFPIGNIEQ